jgi:7,8-dihydropterin-6-yl-methyl-4-(beta-D-ribofuranosyl)aminobenzene 5'-phosphate synthase
MCRSRWGWLLALALCLGGLCVAHHIQIALVSPSPQPQPVTAQVTAATAAPTDTVATPAPTWTLTPMPTMGATRVPPTIHPITLTIVYDNNPLDARLKPAWGFACLVETGQTTVLFDTGGDGPTLMSNMAALAIDPRRIDAVVLSHNHDDHTGGLDALLKVNDHPDVYVPRSFAENLKTRVGGHGYVVQVHEPMTITDHVRTTGELGTAIVEQSLIVETDKGLVVMTGCAHPGIVEIVLKAKSFGDVYLVIGGFHLGDKSAREVETVIAELKQLGVRKVAPSHCTGEKAIAQFKAAFGADFIQAGVGLSIVASAID